MTHYRHTQFGTLTVASVGAAIALLLVISATTEWHPISISVLVILVIALALFYSLTVEVDHRRVRCFFGLGLIRREIPLSEISSARPVRNHWYYGWGIRLTPGGWMWNVSGLDAVELEMVQGKRFRIGTDRPDELVRAIEVARRRTDDSDDRFTT